MKSMKKFKSPFSDNIMGVATVGERGQIVIPKNIREELDVKKGQKFLAIYNGQGLMLMPVDSFKAIIENVSKDINKFNKVIKKG